MTALSAALVSASAWLAPPEHAGTLVALTFLGVVSWRVWSRDEASVRRHGLDLGGLLGGGGLRWGQLGRDRGRALGVAALTALLTFPPFVGAWLLWFEPAHAHAFTLRFPSLWDDVLGQLLLVALPEEAFFRGYLQTSLETRWPPRGTLGKLGLGPANLLGSALFALGHVLTTPSPSRLAVFFPSLVFGLLRQKTGGIGASLTFHAACNLLSGTLARSWGLLP